MSYSADYLQLEVNFRSRRLWIVFTTFILAGYSLAAQCAEGLSSPYGIKSSNVTPTSITLSWEDDNDFDEVAEYRVIVRNMKDDRAFQRIAVFKDTAEYASRSIELNNLIPLAGYEVSVTAINTAGDSSDSGSIHKRKNSIRFILGKRAENDMRSYIFGHSLVYHTLGDSPTIQSIPFWLNELSREGGHEYSVDGQFGFLPDHKLPPWYQWEFENVDSAWNRSFGESNYDNVIITAANFIQKWHRPNGDYAATSWIASIRRFLSNMKASVTNLIQIRDAPSPDYTKTTVVTESLRILDYVREEEPGIDFYIYENWPPFEGDYPFPATTETFKLYHAYTTGEFHNWWIEMQDSMNEARPGSRVLLIPVGSIISKVLMNVPGLSSLTMNDLYEDRGPHGKASMYFLSGLIFYMSLYEELPPASYSIPDSIPFQIRNEYANIVDIIWDELSAFNYSDGSSRVWTKE